MIRILILSLLLLSDGFVLFLQNHSSFLVELRIDGSTELDVGLHLFHLEVWIDSIVLKSVHVHDVLGDMEIFIVILFIKDNEEDVKTRHDRWRDVHIKLERSCFIISA